MADYTFVNPGKEITSTASAAITGGQCVSVSGNNTVAPSGAASSSYIGVAAHDAASGARVTVHTETARVHRTASTGTVVAGDILTTGALGVVATLATPGSAMHQAVGVALEGATGGALVRWKTLR